VQRQRTGRSSVEGLRGPHDGRLRERIELEQEAEDVVVFCAESRGRSEVRVGAPRIFLAPDQRLPNQFVLIRPSEMPQESLGALLVNRPPTFL
jgi:hypothetical protein